ncbi:MAG: hypothetical protein KC486_11960 [Myxococcales bacterium]|nr:hypothetical protein [Myxococcales bacterium]
MIECPWCGSGWKDHPTTCENCGGPMPPRPGQDAGEPPPPTPRQVPKAFERKIRYTTNTLFIAGAILLGVGGLQGFIFTTIGATTGMGPFLWIGPGILLLLGGLGAFFVLAARRKAEGILRAFRDGRAVVGRIVDVYRDTSIKVNGRSPWGIVYSFSADGRTIEGKAQTWDVGAQGREAGRPVHVLYVAADPEQNTLWPPVR